MNRYTLRWYLLALILFALDQFTKQVASSHLDYAIPVQITSFFNWTLAHNPGAAFSMLSDAGGWQHWLLGGVAAVISIVLVIWIFRLGAEAKILGAGLALVLSGAVGNLVDRVRFGYVVDFIQLHYQDWYWPAFNVADSAITVGAVLLVIDSFFDRPSADCSRVDEDSSRTEAGSERD